MKKIILHSFAGIFCFAMITGCGKDVKTPSNKPASAAKTTTSPVTQPTTPGQDQNSNTCGSESGTSGDQSGTTSNGGY